MNPHLQAMLQQAIQAFQGKNFDEAESTLKDLLQNDINSVDTIFELGVAYAKTNRLREALAIFDCVQPYKGDDIRIPFNLGLIYSLEGMHELAIKAYDLALRIQPNDVETLINKGSTYIDIKNYILALEALEKAIQIRPNSPEAWSNKGVALNNLHLYQESINAYNEAIRLRPNYHEAWSNKSMPLNKLRRFPEAFEACDKALILKPDYAEGWFNKGNTFHEVKRYDEAIDHYDKALSLKPEYAEVWFNKGNALHELKRHDEAIVHYNKALSLKPDYAEGWSNKGNALNELKRYDEAIADYDKALALKSDHAEGWSNKGVTLHELKRYEEAIAHYDKALSLRPDYAEGWSNKGNALNELKRYDEAIANYDKALSLRPEIDWVSGDLLHVKMKICSWSDLTKSLEYFSKKLIENKRVATPFPLLALSDDALLHKKCSEIFAQAIYPSNPNLGFILKSSKKDKIRIAYFSPDFRNHPVSLLTSELFEIHDRGRFEVFAFSLQKAPIGDETNLRLRKKFDKFIDVDNMSDQEIAQLARELEIDIAIDLAGPTQHSRTGIFSYRAAPIQVNWLGYPGTIGADFIDYIVADKIIIPESHQHFYSEKIVYLPNTYMVDDSNRTPSTKVFTREECGLPQNAFVFCCFNNDYKFNPQVLDSWSRVLLTAKNSVIWISENNKRFRSNIRTEFENRGIDSDRIIFAQRVEMMADYLSRYALADLFLDTYLYNAHTTALDSLKAGVPVLTLMGQSFPSRVAASLLNAIGLPELIANTQEEYESLAIELALNPKKLAGIKLNLANNRLTTPLFDTPLFTKNLEAAYSKMIERYQADLEPEHMFIA
jgi:predicted O-linked N-acetylglucosamine transferase (SPINDLY family)